MVERNREGSKIRVLSMGFRLSTLTVKILHKKKIGMQVKNNFKTINRF